MVDLEKLKRWLIQVPLLWLIELIASILYSNSILPGVPTELIEGGWFSTHPAFLPECVLRIISMLM